MSFSAGARLGPYEILSPLGAGGMGEVFRAKDTKLGREVAIKVLPERLARNAEALGRFEREARLLASLNHPGIAAIYGLEDEGQIRFLVLELVEGSTLSGRLSHGPLALREALEIALQTADALAAAHERGIVHRDLKPSNVMITPEGRVKVLDFGLAKAITDVSRTTDLSQSPTIDADATREGTILGTPSYMSPEQARGRSVDKRTDLWSLGCLLYEMLTGRKAFERDTVSDTLAGVLNAEPAWQALPHQTPENVRQLLRRCLEKDAERRLRDAADARLELEEALAAQIARPGRLRRLATLWAGAAAAAALVIFTIFWTRRHGGALPIHTRLTQVTLSEGIEISPAWSPDGRQLAYIRETGGVRKIFVKKLQTGEESQATHGSYDDIQPVWTPTGGRILFVRARQPDRKLEPGDVFGQYDGADVWALEMQSGLEHKLIENAFNPSLSPDGLRIAVDASWVGPRRIWAVDSEGRNPQQLTSDDSEAVVHIRPRWSPDGTKIAFQNIERTKFDIRIVEVSSKKMTWITNDLVQDIDPEWSRSGNFLYFSSPRSGGLNLWRVPVSRGGSPSGALEQVTAGAGQDVEAAISPDGRKLAFSILKQNADLWVLPVSPNTGEPAGPPKELIATTREDSRGSFSPDGSTVAFNSDRSGDMNIWLFSVRGGSARALTHGPGGDYQPEWSPDGKTIVFFSSRSGNADIWKADVANGQLAQLTKTPAIDVNPFYSPDARHIAFQSDRGGHLEVWMMGSDGGEARPLTQVGVTGHFLRWTKDGQFVVFRCPGHEARTMKAPISGGDAQPITEVSGGSHMSFSPDFSKIMDVVGHKALWVSPLENGKPTKVFAFDDPSVRIDYPVWSPDGTLVLFDRFRPQGGDIWILEGFE